MIKLLNPDCFNQLPKAVLFDTDNTLYHYDPAHEAAMKAVRDKMTRTLSIDPAQFESVFQKAREEIKSRLNHTASSHSRLLYLQRMLEMMGLGSQVLRVLDFEQTYWRTFLSHAELFDGIKELLDDLRLLGIATAIVTDLTAQIQFRKIIYFDLDHHFDYIITSEEAGHDKPHLAPFQLALEKLNIKKNECIWMIGDNPINDIKGARESIGAITIQKVHSGVKIGVNDSAPDCIIDEFNELRKLLQKIASMEYKQCDYQPA